MSMSMTPDEMIAVIKAHTAGKLIQCKRLDSSKLDWCNANYPSWDFARFEYRIALPSKILKWQWLYTDFQGDLTITSYFYANETAARNMLQSVDTLIGKAVWTETAVDA